MIISWSATFMQREDADITSSMYSLRRYLFRKSVVEAYQWTHFSRLQRKCYSSGVQLAQNMSFCNREAWKKNHNELLLALIVLQSLFALFKTILLTSSL